MSNSSASSSATSPYPSSSVQAIGGVLSGPGPSDSNAHLYAPHGADGDNANFYASGNSRVAMSEAPSCASPPPGNAADYLYALDTRANRRQLSSDNSFTSGHLEDSQKRSYHPIQMIIGGGESSGALQSSGHGSAETIATSPEGFGLARHPTGSRASAPLSRHSSFTAAGDRAPSSLQAPSSGLYGSSRGPASPLTPFTGGPQEVMEKEKLDSAFTPTNAAKALRSLPSHGTTDESPPEPSLTVRGASSSSVPLLPSAATSQLPMPNPPWRPPAADGENEGKREEGKRGGFSTPPVTPLSASASPPQTTVYQTPLALLAESRSRTSSPPPPAQGDANASSHMSSSSSSSSEEASPPGGGDQRPAVPLAGHYTPLIQQYDYRKTDLKCIAATGAFTMGDVNTLAVKARLLRHELLGRAEPIESIQERAMKAGRMKPLKPSAAPVLSDVGEMEKGDGKVSAPSPPREVDVADFRDTLAVFDNALLAIAFALWGGVARYNDLVAALLDYCATDVRSSRSVMEEAAVLRSDSVNTALRRPSSVAAKARMNLPFSSVLRFLNHCGVDVLVVSPNRKSASSFCAKRQQILNRLRHLQHQDGETNVLPPVSAPRRRRSVADETEPVKRVLIALSYDDRKRLWCPMTTSRSIRQIAAAWHTHRRQLRQQQRQSQRESRLRREVEVAVAATKSEREAKLHAWQQRMAAHRRKRSDSAAAATGDTEETSRGPPRLEVVVPVGEESTDESHSVPVKAGNRLPFEGMLYPTLVQTNVNFFTVICEGTRPYFGLARLRLLLSLVIGFVVVLFGIAFLIYVTKTTTVCFFDSVAGQCFAFEDDLYKKSDNRSRVDLDNSGSYTSCLAVLEESGMEGFRSSLPRRFLYGDPSSPGNCLIVTVCCVFAAAIASTLVAFFAARYLALGGVRPLFHYMLQAAQILLGAVTCAFAAYTLFAFRARRSTLECVALKPDDAQLCTARLASCGGHYYYAAQRSMSGGNVALALAIVYLVLCVVHWAISFLPVLPSWRKQDTIPTATPDTYAFRPSLFAPDGATPQEVAKLREVMRRPLHRDLRQSVKHADRLLTATTTIGEMMQANRAQSLRQMQLQEQQRRRRRGGDGSASQARRGSSRRGTGAGAGPSNATEREEDVADPSRRPSVQRYMACSDDDSEALSVASDDSHFGSSRSHSEDHVRHRRSQHRLPSLAPRLLARVDEIGTSVMARSSPNASSQNPFSSSLFPSPSAANATIAGETAFTAPAPMAVEDAVHETGSVLAAAASPPPASSPSLRKAVVAADTSINSQDLDGQEKSSPRLPRRVVVTSPPPPLTAGTTLPVYTAAPAAPRKPAPPALTRGTSLSRPGSSMEGGNRASSPLRQLPVPVEMRRSAGLTPAVEESISKIVANLEKRRNQSRHSGSAAPQA